MRSRLPLLRSLAAFPLAVAVGLFGLGLDWMTPTGPAADAGSLIGNPFGPPGARCGALAELHLPAGAWACSHGADPAPPGVDIHRRFDSGVTRSASGKFAGMNGFQKSGRDGARPSGKGFDRLCASWL